MFGGQDENAQMPQSGASATATDDTLNGVADLVGGGAAPASTPAPDAMDSNPTGGFMPAPSEPAQASIPAPNEEAEDVVARAASPDVSGDTNDLLDLKQQALQQLTPIVGHLSQTPEEKFRTTMMLIQASDNQTLLKDAYEAAQAITDEKTKAQALLDVVNEINYFTQNKQQG